MCIPQLFRNFPQLLFEVCKFVGRVLRSLLEFTSLVVVVRVCPSTIGLARAFTRTRLRWFGSVRTPCRFLLVRRRSYIAVVGSAVETCCERLVQESFEFFQVGW